MSKSVSIWQHRNGYGETVIVETVICRNGYWTLF